MLYLTLEDSHLSQQCKVHWKPTTKGQGEDDDDDDNDGIAYDEGTLGAFYDGWCKDWSFTSDKTAMGA